MSQMEESTANPPETELTELAAKSGAPADPAPIPVAPAPRRRGAFVGGILGGVAAAVLGFGAAKIYPDGWPLRGTSDLQTQLAAQSQEIAALKAEVTQLSNTAPVPDASLIDRIAALEGKSAEPVDLAPLADRLAALETRLAAIESLPADGSGASPAAIAALQADVQALKAGGNTAGLEGLAAETEARLKAATDRAMAMQTETEAVLAKARARTALGQLTAAMDSGAPYAGLLSDLGDVPAALADHAASGVTTMPQLRAEFPDAARMALEAALAADMGASWSERIGSFLRTQTGARSLVPREGSDPDAVLSRAAAALDAGDLALALTEIATLPDAGKVPMQAWQAKAEARQAALAAMPDLVARIDG
jgi:hypothetical protein